MFSYISEEDLQNPKKKTCFIFWEMELSSPNIKKVLIFFQKIFCICFPSLEIFSSEFSPSESSKEISMSSLIHVDVYAPLN